MASPNNPFSYLDQLAKQYAQSLRMPTLAQTVRPFRPMPTGYTPTQQPIYGTPATGLGMPKLPSAGQTMKPFTPRIAAPTSQPATTLPPPNAGFATTNPTADPELKVSLETARIQNTERQVPEHLKEAWNTLGADWWKQFSTWRQSYVNDFLQKYSEGDFAGANEVARRWYDYVDTLGKEREAAAREQEYWDQQSQYRQSARVA